MSQIQRFLTWKFNMFNILTWEFNVFWISRVLNLDFFVMQSQRFVAKSVFGLCWIFQCETLLWLTSWALSCPSLSLGRCTFWDSENGRVTCCMFNTTGLQVHVQQIFRQLSCWSTWFWSTCIMSCWLNKSSLCHINPRFTETNDQTPFLGEITRKSTITQVFAWETNIILWVKSISLQRPTISTGEATRCYLGAVTRHGAMKQQVTNWSGYIWAECLPIYIYICIKSYLDIIYEI